MTSQYSILFPSPILNFAARCSACEVESLDIKWN